MPFLFPQVIPFLKTTKMDPPNDFEALTEAFSGFGVDEDSMASILGKWHLEHLGSFRKRTKFFLEDERLFERDARLVHEAITKGPQAYGLLIEIACTRSLEELLGARKDVASQLEGIERKVSATSVRILTTRSKLHLKAVVKYYKEIYGKNIDEDLDTLMSLKETLQCLCNPQAHFSKVLNDAFKDDADENTKEALTRVIVTRINVDMKEIIEEFDKQYKIPLTQKIEDVALGNYKDFLVSLIRRVA
ncbi:hypothetical protein AAG906_001004 [Vitis piasezkii]